MGAFKTTHKENYTVKIPCAYKMYTVTVYQ